MKNKLTYTLTAALLAIPLTYSTQAEEDSVRALYVTGGGWHDYEGQVSIVTKAMEEAVPNIDITVSKVEGHGGEHNRHPAFKDENWADGYDVVVYNKCNAPHFSDDEWIERIVQPHRDGLPAVLIHGAVHNFWPDEERTGQWGEFCGIISRNHERGAPVTVTFTERDHPILAGLPEEWSYEHGELYRIHGMADGVQSLATGVSSDGEEHMIVWTHEFGQGRVFGTTIGHANETMKTDEFQTLLGQGLQWVLGRRG